MRTDVFAGVFSSNLRYRTIAATAHNGTLTKKIHRQDRNSENTPPSVGPTIADIAHTLAR